MSNDNPNNSEPLYKNPTIIAALITTIFGGMFLMITEIVKNIDKYIPQKIESFGEIKVEADKHGGTKFINEHKSAQTYDFKASGEWTYNPLLVEDYGLSGPGGYQNLKASANYYLPGVPEGALIVRRYDSNNQEYYEFVGNSKKIKLNPKDQIFFKINDTNDEQSGKSYQDNDGSLTVQWNCITCKK
ncbi:MAG: hypothetical protein Fur0025_01650 [Oscillatoriaceae cyanobacterium]